MGTKRDKDCSEGGGMIWQALRDWWRQRRCLEVRQPILTPPREETEHPWGDLLAGIIIQGIAAKLKLGMPLTPSQQATKDAAPADFDWARVPTPDIHLLREPQK